MNQPICHQEPISGPRHPSYQSCAVQAGAVERGRCSSRGIIGGRPGIRSYSTIPDPPSRVHGRSYPAWRYGGPPVVLTILKVIRNELDEDLKDGLARNMFLFQRKLDLQKEKLFGRKATSATIVSEGDLEPHDEIIDPVSSFSPFISFSDSCRGAGPAIYLERYGMWSCRLTHLVLSDNHILSELETQCQSVPRPHRRSRVLP